MQAMLSGIAYSIALRQWLAESVPHFVSSIILAMVIIFNVIDPKENNVKVLKKQGIVIAITGITIIMFAEVVNNIPDQKWWQNAILVSLLGSFAIAYFEGIVPSLKTNSISKLKVLKDTSMAILNSIGICQALILFLKSDLCAIFVTCIYCVLATIDFSHEKQLRALQISVAGVVIVMTSVLAMFMDLYMNVFVALAISLGISSFLFSLLMEYLMKESNDDSEVEDSEVDDADVIDTETSDTEVNNTEMYDT